MDFQREKPSSSEVYAEISAVVIGQTVFLVWPVTTTSVRHFTKGNFIVSIPIDNRFYFSDNNNTFLKKVSSLMNFIKRPFLGELEMAVLEHLWSNGEFDANSLHSSIGKARGISHNTIQSTLERLFKKKLLTRKKISRAYVYHASVDRDELMGRMINDVVTTISKDNTDGMLAAFVDIAARTEGVHLDRLEQLINEYRSNQNNDTSS